MLSLTSQYALRVLLLLAWEPPGKRALGRDLARDGGIPANYLSKILLTLHKAGFIEAVRGRGGGHRLNRAAAEIRLIDIVELIDGTGSYGACVLGLHEKCNEEAPCPAHDAYRQVQTVYADFLEKTTIAELAAGHKKYSEEPYLTPPKKRTASPQD